MRLQRYLNEKYNLGFQNWGDTVDVFENPNSKELKELKQANYGNIRFFINMKTKKVWMWDGNKAIHEDVINNGLLPTAGFNYNDYVFRGRHADIIFGGTIDNGFVRSDSWDASPKAQYDTPDLAKRADKKTLENVQKMAKQDFSWLKKYGIDPVRVKEIVDSTVWAVGDALA